MDRRKPKRKRGSGWTRPKRRVKPERDGTPETWEVDRIVWELPSVKGRRRFLVTWNGIDAEGNTWPPSVIYDHNLLKPATALEIWDEFLKTTSDINTYYKTIEQLVADSIIPLASTPKPAYPSTSSQDATPTLDNKNEAGPSTLGGPSALSKIHRLPPLLNAPIDVGSQHDQPHVTSPFDSPTVNVKTEDADDVEMPSGGSELDSDEDFAGFIWPSNV